MHPFPLHLCELSHIFHTSWSSLVKKQFWLHGGKEELFLDHSSYLKWTYDFHVLENFAYLSGCDHDNSLSLYLNCGGSEITRIWRALSDCWSQWWNSCIYVTAVSCGLERCVRCVVYLYRVILRRHAWRSKNARTDIYTPEGCDIFTQYSDTCRFPHNASRDLKGMRIASRGGGSFRASISW